jgi:arylsulfatase A-like enzyme
VRVVFQTVHEPLEVPDEYRAPYNDSSKKSYMPRHDLQTYCAMATALDSAAGAIVDAVNATGRLPDTLIVFTSDNVQHPGPPHPRVVRTKSRLTRRGPLLRCAQGAMDSRSNAVSTITGGMAANGPLKGGKTMTTEGGEPTTQRPSAS